MISGPPVVASAGRAASRISLSGLRLVSSLRQIGDLVSDYSDRSAAADCAETGGAALDVDAI